MSGNLLHTYRNNWYHYRTWTELSWRKGSVSYGLGADISLSLPNRGPAQGRRLTGIWNLAHSISDPRAKISGIFVMVRRSSTISRGTGSIVCSLICPAYLVCACAMFLARCAYQNQEKQRQLSSEGKDELNPRSQSTRLSTWHRRLIEGRQHWVRRGYVEQKGTILLYNLINAKDASFVTQAIKSPQSKPRTRKNKKRKSSNQRISSKQRD